MLSFRHKIKTFQEFLLTNEEQLEKKKHRIEPDVPVLVY